MSNFERWVIAHPKQASLAFAAVVLLLAGYLYYGLAWAGEALR